MGRIPEDAAHWDSGDWIEWHRQSQGLDDRPCIAAAEEDEMARLTALKVSLLRAAKTYYVLTGTHLPVYPAIARVHAAIEFDLPIDDTQEAGDSGIRLMHLPPHGPDNVVQVDLSTPFNLLVVVRIKDNFNVEARMIRREELPQTDEPSVGVSWQSLPRRR